MVKNEKPDDTEGHTKLTMSSSPAREDSANAGSSSGNLDEKPRLSEHEKKANHIASGWFSAIFYSPLQPLTYDNVAVFWVANFLPRTKTTTSYPRRIRQIDRIGAEIRGAGEERECGAEEDSGLHARPVGREEEIDRAD